MPKFQKIINKVTQRVMDLVTGNGLMQEENIVTEDGYEVPGMAETIRACAAEGIVLLKNEKDTLPLKAENMVSVFGRCQNDWFYVGYGSGGDVHPPYKVSLMDGLRQGGIRCNEELAKVYADWGSQEENKADHGWWGHWPYYHPEMPLDEATVSNAAKASQVALVVIGRAAGEDRENVLEPGSYYLAEDEKAMLQQVTAKFEKVVLIMNCGSVMDMSFVEEYPISAVVYAWQLGQESGNAVADVLSGKVNPSGKLTATVAKRYADYPSSKYFGNKEYNNYTEDIFVGYRHFATFNQPVQYPFGFGLSYTTFTIKTEEAVREAEGTTLRVRITNTGSCVGKEILQVYCNPPAGKLSKATKNLVAFGKTKELEPGESQVLELYVADYDCASFDDSGKTGYPQSFVLESGEYRLLAGNSSETETVACTFYVEQTQCLLTCQDACGPVEEFSVLTNEGSIPVFQGKRDLRQRILDNLPAEIPYTGDVGIKLADVKAGNATLEDFVAQLTDKELGDLSRGEGAMGSSLGIIGNAGAFGGITKDLRNKGVPPLITTDGPSGIRIKKRTTLLPCGTAIACSWNPELAEEMFAKVGAEAKFFGVDVLLSPGMNIHRNPLCGRNFEYYSEDPYLCGKIAAAAVRGIQKGGVSACPKHFACNNQEVNRNYNDSRVSQRALREIYLKCFEIVVKESDPQNIMTSYNKINGVWSHYNYDLVTTVLRQEWGYKGNIVTDWWMRLAAMPEFPKIKNNAYRVRAQVDVLMPGAIGRSKNKYVFDKSQLATLGKPDGLTRGELQRSAMNVLRFALTRI